MRFSTPLSNSIASAPEPKQQFVSLAHQGAPFTGPYKVPTTKPLSQAEKDTKAVRVVNPQFRKLNVAATDNYVAPVAKLTQWLASDPTKPKKEFLTVRKGNNVIAKSAKFENPELAIGSKKAQQLQEVAEKTIVTDNRKQFEHGSVEGSKASEKSDASTSKQSEKADTAPKEAKSLEEVPVESEKTEIVEVVELEMVDEDLPLEIETKQEVVVVLETPMGELTEGKKVEQDAMSELTGTIESTPPAIVESSTMELTESEDSDSQKSEAKDEGEEAVKSFEEAKKSFGAGVAPMTTVQIRKQKLEQMEAEARRRANNPYGELKPSWKRPHKSHNKPSDAWARSFQGTLPPKKTIAELP
ncbi:MAG: hypothetical protein SGARI_003982 [Bacillariaceae sp.]